MIVLLQLLVHMPKHSRAWPALNSLPYTEASAWRSWVAGAC